MSNPVKPILAASSDCCLKPSKSVEGGGGGGKGGFDKGDHTPLNIQKWTRLSDNGTNKNTQGRITKYGIWLDSSEVMSLDCCVCFALVINTNKQSAKHKQGLKRLCNTVQY